MFGCKTRVRQWLTLGVRGAHKASYDPLRSTLYWPRRPTCTAAASCSSNRSNNREAAGPPASGRASREAKAPPPPPPGPPAEPALAPAAEAVEPFPCAAPCQDTRSM